jgi:CheY-like chemotaxis protein
MKNKILVVDDDKELLQELSNAMSLNAYEVTTSGNGAEALELIPRVMPDLIMLDMKMDGMSGFQLASRLRQMPGVKDIPIVAMSGYYTDSEYALLMKISGVKKYFVKPLNMEDVVKQLNEVLKEQG